MIVIEDDDDDDAPLNKYINK